MLKNTKDITLKIFFSDLRYRCPIRLVPTYILLAKKRLLRKFQPDS